MQKRMRRLMVMLLVFAMTISHMTVVKVSAEDLLADPQRVEVVLSEEKKQELGIIQTKDIYEYADALKNLTISFEKRRSRLNGSVDDSTDLYRAIVKGTPLFEGFSPLTIIESPYGEYIVQFETQQEAEEFVQAQENVKNVEWAELDRLITIDDPDDVEYELYDDAHIGNWGTDCIEAPEMIAYIQEKIENGEITDDEIIVAVIDTGVDGTHEFLKDHITKSTEGYSFADETNGYVDTFGHGTHVAGTIVDCTLGLNVTILSIKCGVGRSLSNTTAAIRMAADKGATVINCSFGGPGITQEEIEAIQYAIDKGCIICAAAGNELQNCDNYYPAGAVYPGVICVSALNQYRDTLMYAYFTNYGNSVDVGMPGFKIWSSVPNNDYDYDTGTSMAAPHASASAALIKMLYREADPSEVEAIMHFTTEDLGAIGHDIYYGYGVVKLTKLIDYDHYSDITILTQPSSLEVESGHGARFIIEAENVLKYSWQQRANANTDWVSVDDSYNGRSVLTMIASEDYDGYQYRCALYSPAGIVYSDIVTLNVLPQGSSDVLDSGICGDSMYWELKDNILYINGEEKMYNYYRGDAPWYVWRDKIEYIVFGASGDGETIGSYAFSDLVNLKAIVGSASEISISVGSSYLPYTVFSVGDGAFYNCSKLKSIVMSDDLLDIGIMAFANCTKLQYVEFNDCLKTIGDCAFKNCSSLSCDIKLPRTLISLTNETFANCDLKNIYYEGTQDEWMLMVGSPNIQAGPNALLYFRFADNYYYSLGYIIGHELHISGLGDFPHFGSAEQYPWYPHDLIEVVTLHEGVTSINDNALSMLDIWQLYLPMSLETISKNALIKNDAIDVYYAGTIYTEWNDLVEGVEEGNDALFNGDLYLTCGNDVYWSKRKNAIKIIGYDNIWDNCINNWKEFKDEIEIVEIKGKLDVPCNAFEGFSKLKVVILDGDISSVQENAFLGCDSITDVYLNDPVEWNRKIQVFDGNETLENATAHQYKCGDIVVLELPEKIETIAGENARLYISLYCSIKYHTQWFYINNEGRPKRIGAANDEEVVFSTSPEMDGYEYYMSLTSSHTSKTNRIKLYVSSTTPSIITSPRDPYMVGIAGKVGKSVTISVNATGGGLHYQWQKYKPSTGWINIEGNDDKSLAVVIEEGDNGAKYRCIVSNLLGTATSSSWKVMIIRQVDPGTIKPPVEKKEKLPHNFVNQLQLVSRIPS